MPRVKYDDEGRRIGWNPNAYTSDMQPKYLRVYDNGGETVDRYTVVFTNTKNQGCNYLMMSGAPFHPQGVGMHGWDSRPIDQPTYSHIGKRITFRQLPLDCQKCAMQDYEAFWGKHP